MLRQTRVSSSGSRDTITSWSRLPLPKVNPRGNLRRAPRGRISGSRRYDPSMKVDRVRETVKEKETEEKRTRE